MSQRLDAQHATADRPGRRQATRAESRRRGTLLRDLVVALEGARCLGRRLTLASEQPQVKRAHHWNVESKREQV